MDNLERLSRARAWLFDLDGTLVEQRVDFALMRAEVMRTIAAYDLASCLPFAGQHPVLELVDHVEHEAAKASSEVAAEFRLAADGAIERVELMAAPSARVFDGVQELFAALALRGFKTAIVTRNCRKAAEYILTANNIPCDLLVAREDAPKVKPNSEHLQVALDAFGVSGAESVMCGDYVMDILAGKAVGALTVAVASHGDLARFADSCPDLTVWGVGELVAWL